MELDNLFYGILLLPGFGAYRVFCAMTVRKQQPAIVTISEILLFELVIVSCYAFFADMNPDLLLQALHEHDARVTLALNWKSLAALTGLSIGTGVLAGALFNWDRMLGPLRYWQMTRQSVHPTVWQAAFQYRRGWVVVHLQNELRISGYLRFYSDTPTEGSVYLEKARFLTAAGDPVEAGSILLTKQSDIQMIQFLKGQ
jgi:hypothetical protein